MSVPIATESAPALPARQPAARATLREWSVLTLVLAALCAALGSLGGLGRPDQTLYDAAVSLNSHATRIWRLFLDRLPDVSDHVREHVVLFKAIVDGDEDEAARLALAHIEHFEQAIRSVL